MILKPDLILNTGLCSKWSYTSPRGPQFKDKLFLPLACFLGATSEMEPRTYFCRVLYSLGWIFTGSILEDFGRRYPVYEPHREENYRTRDIQRNSVQGLSQEMEGKSRKLDLWSSIWEWPFIGWKLIQRER